MKFVAEAAVQREGARRAFMLKSFGSTAHDARQRLLNTIAQRNYYGANGTRPKTCVFELDNSGRRKEENPSIARKANS